MGIAAAFEFVLGAIGVLAVAMTLTGTSGCSRKSAVGHEPTFREEFPGRGCKGLAVESGTYEAVCSKSSSWAAACPIGWKELEGAQVAVLHGPYEGPLCFLNRDECGPTEKVDFVGAALKLPGGTWEPGGLLVVGDRKIDVRATLLAGCAKATNTAKR